MKFIPAPISLTITKFSVVRDVFDTVSTSKENSLINRNNYK